MTTLNWQDLGCQTEIDEPNKVELYDTFFPFNFSREQDQKQFRPALTANLRIKIPLSALEKSASLKTAAAAIFELVQVNRLPLCVGESFS